MVHVGKSIRLFLADGTPHGILTAEIINWTGHIITAPRSKIIELVKRPEMDKTGIYILSGEDPDGSSLQLVYIGESDNVGKRLKQHSNDDKKDYWEHVCVVTSKDKNLTKAHAKYLESKLISAIQESGAVKLMNGNAPIFETLPEADCADMEYFIKQLRLVLPVLGMNYLHERKHITQDVIPEITSQDLYEVQPSFELKSPKLSLTAKATEIDGEFIVLRGSDARAKWQGAENHNYRKLFEQLHTLGKIQLTKNNEAKFTEDYTFSSPSAAAAVIYGRAANGRTAWKTTNTNQTYEKWQNDLLAKSVE